MKARILAVLAATGMLVALLLFARHASLRGRAQQRAAEEVAPAAEPPPDPPAAASGRRAGIPVRDLADGSPLPGFRVRLGSHEIEADDAGLLPLPDAVGEDARLVPSDPAWVLAPAGAARALWEGALWAHRTFRVRGRVSGRGATALDPRRVKLEAARDRAEAAPPWTSSWMTDHDVDTDVWLTEGARADGTFEVELPRVCGFVLRARATGWRPAQAPLPVDGRTEVVEADLVLVPALRVRGLATSGGRPVPGTSVHVYVVCSGAAPDTFDEEVEWTERTFRKCWRNEKGEVRAMFGCETDLAGRFDLALDVEGEGLLWVQHPGHATCYRMLGPLGGDVAVDVALEPARGASVRIVRDGLPARDAYVYLADLEFEDVRPAFVLTTDAQGSARADWLVPGHCYEVCIEGVPAARELAWNGQAEIDVSALPVAR